MSLWPRKRFGTWLALGREKMRSTLKCGTIVGLALPTLAGALLGLRVLLPTSESPVFHAAQTVFNISTIPLFWLTDRIMSARGIEGDAAMQYIPVLMATVAIYYALVGFGIGCVIGRTRRK